MGDAPLYGVYPAKVVDVLDAGMLQIDAGTSRFSGTVSRETMITNSVVASSYTPGAGNIW